jgi:hypothetical protein
VEERGPDYLQRLDDEAEERMAWSTRVGAKLAAVRQIARRWRRRTAI